MAENAQTADTTFHQFSKLPKEMRDEIWDLALWTPRVLAAKVPTFDVTKNDNDTLVPIGPPPSLRSACYESRARAVLVQCPFNSDCSIYIPNGSSRSREIFVNLKIDTIWITNCNVTFTTFSSSIDWDGEFPRVALPASVFHGTIGIWWRMEAWKDCIVRFAYHMYLKKVTDVSLVCGNWMPGAGECVDLKEVEMAVDNTILQTESHDERSGIVKLTTLAKEDGTVSLESECSWSELAQTAMNIINDQLQNMAGKAVLTEKEDGKTEVTFKGMTAQQQEFYPMYKAYALKEWRLEGIRYVTAVGSKY